MKEERFSSGTPSKNKISNFGPISPLYPNFIYHPLSLSLNLKKRKNRKEGRHLSPWTVQFIIYIWRFESVSLGIVKDSCIFMLPRGLNCSLQFCYKFVESHFLWKCISWYSKGFMYFYVTTWSKLFFAVLLRIFWVTFPFQLLFASCYLA